MTPLLRAAHTKSRAEALARTRVELTGDSGWTALWRFAPVATAALLATRCAGSDPSEPTLTPTPTPTAKPNIVLVIADDADPASITYMPRVQDLLVRQGATFSNVFACFPLCAPARASMLTGLYAHNHGVSRNTDAAATLRSSGYEASSVAVRLRQAGYQTAMIGKYINSYAGEDPAPGWDTWAAMYTSANTGAYYDYSIRENDRIVSYARAASDYSTDVLAQRGVEFIRQATQQQRPFLLWFAPTAPHNPAKPAPRHANEFPAAAAPRTASFNEQDVSDKPEYLRNLPLLTQADIDDIDAFYRNRLRSMLAVDDALASFVDAVSQAGQLNDTWFVFVSDNGFMLGQHRFERGKDAPYEPSLRVPLVVRGPGVPANVTRDHLVTLVDLGATLPALGGAGVSDGSLDGHSLVPLLGVAAPTAAAWRSELLIEHERQADGPAAIPEYAGLHTATQVYVSYETGEIEYYDLSSDPDQIENRSLDATTATVWASRLASVRDCRGSACP
jgi:N-acetylglucosamine-6-sulfatase